MLFLSLFIPSVPQILCVHVSFSKYLCVPYTCQWVIYLLLQDLLDPRTLNSLFWGQSASRNTSLHLLAWVANHISSQSTCEWPWCPSQGSYRWEVDSPPQDSAHCLAPINTDIKDFIFYPLFSRRFLDQTFGLVSHTGAQEGRTWSMESTDWKMWNLKVLLGHSVQPLAYWGRASWLSSLL